MRYFRFNNVTSLAREIATHIFTRVQSGEPVDAIRFSTDGIPSVEEWFYLDTDGLKEQAFHESCGRYKLIDLAPQFDAGDAHIIAGGYLGGNALATTGLIDRSTGGADDGGCRQSAHRLPPRIGGADRAYSVPVAAPIKNFFI